MASLPHSNTHRPVVWSWKKDRDRRELFAACSYDGTAEQYYSSGTISRNPSIPNLDRPSTAISMAAIPRTRVQKAACLSHFQPRHPNINGNAKQQHNVNTRNGSSPPGAHERMVRRDGLRLEISHAQLRLQLAHKRALSLTMH